MRPPKIPRVYLLIWGSLFAVVGLLTFLLPDYFETPAYIQAFAAGICIYFALRGPPALTFPFAAIFGLLYTIVPSLGRKEGIDPIQRAVTFAVGFLWFFMVLMHLGDRKEENESVAEQPRVVHLSHGPSCGVCGKRLERIDLGEGAGHVVGKAPLLYLGVVCAKCRKVECNSCKGRNVEAPCKWCGSPVKPAYEHYLVNTGENS